MTRSEHGPALTRRSAPAFQFLRIGVARYRSLSAKQIDVLRACGVRPLCTTPTNQEAFIALAALGGHLRSNGPPGWLVLGRGYDRLLILEQGWIAGEKGRDPIDN